MTFAKAAWCDLARRHLSQIEGLSARGVDEYEGEVASGASALMALSIGGDRVGTIIWSVREETDGVVFYVDEMFCDPRDGYDLTAATFRMAHQFAPKVGANVLRFITRRAGLVRKVRGHFDAVGYILEKRLEH